MVERQRDWAAQEQAAVHPHGLPTLVLPMEVIMASHPAALMPSQQVDGPLPKAPVAHELQPGAAYQHQHRANHMTLQPLVLVMTTSPHRMVLLLLHLQPVPQHQDLHKTLPRPEAGKAVH
jgi:hypothetical protein